MDCIFCKIIDGQIPCMKLYEDDLVMAYLDISPDSDGHTLIIPKTHYKDIFDIKDDVLNHIFFVAKKMMNELKDKLNCDGFSLLQNNGEIQEVKHFHLHIKPYYSNNKATEIIKHTDKLKDPKKIYEILTK